MFVAVQAVATSSCTWAWLCKNPGILCALGELVESPSVFVCSLASCSFLDTSYYTSLGTLPLKSGASGCSWLSFPPSRTKSAFSQTAENVNNNHKCAFYCCAGRKIDGDSWLTWLFHQWEFIAVHPKGHLLWMQECLHHFETHGNPLLGIYKGV